MKKTMSFLAQSDGNMATILAVQVLMMLVLSAGVAKCWSISRRPTTNAKCVMALALLLIACLIPFVSRTLSLIVPVPFPGLITFVSFAIILAAAVLAFVGLRECSRERGRYAQGKAQAVWTLASSSVVAALPFLLLAQARWHVIGVPNAPMTAQVLVFTNLNFKFFVPGDPWREVQGDPLDFKSTLVLRCTRPEVHFAVVAQPAPMRKYSSEQFETLAMNTFSNALDDIRILSRVPIRKENLEGVQLEIDAGHRGQTFYLENRLFKLNDWTYQLITWGPKRYEATVMEYGKRLGSRFELLDYTRKGNRFDDLPSVSQPMLDDISRSR